MPLPPRVSRVAWLPDSLFDVLQQESLRTAPHETGGVLMGYWTHQFQEVVICKTIGPGPKAKHGLTFFQPDHDWQEREIARIYHDSGRYVTYLGDWHSHPGGPNTLSLKDRLTLCRIAYHQQARAAMPLMGIIAGENWALTIWNQEKSKIFNCVPFPRIGVMKIRQFSATCFST